MGFEQIDATQVAAVGGKGANLGELSRTDGIRVPGGFCVTAEAFRRAGGIAIPDDVAAAIRARLGEHAFYAVRSSATAEDSAAASFAGLHDTYLDVTGPDEVLRHVRRVWDSLSGERAIAYRRRNGIDDRDVAMAVVVQRMVRARAAGVLFTADPVTSNRRATVIEAAPGLGEELVSGLVSPDRYTVGEGELVASEPRGQRPLLSDSQVLELARLGRLIEAHFGSPQDIEWCLGDEGFEFVQTRPITTLFPIPGPNDPGRRIYLSVGHQQMMTEPMKPLGLSLFQLTALPQMHEAAGRLFVDATERLVEPATRGALLDTFERSDPLTADAVRAILGEAHTRPAPVSPARDADPAIVPELIARTQASIAGLERDIAPLSGPPLFDFILADIQELKRLLFEPQNREAIAAGMEAAWWLNDQLEEWLGEPNAVDALSQSVSGNVTSEMGLALLDVADVIRPHPEVVAYLEQAHDEDLLAGLAGISGGQEARDAISAYLDSYGMRCVGEIDITRPRWSERPATLVPLILANVRNFEPGAGRRHFERGLAAAADKERDVLERLRALPDGDSKAAETKRMIDRVRAFSGYREYPKYGIVSRYLIYKRALLQEADRLALADTQDSFYLSFQELHEAVRSGAVDEQLIVRRRAEFRSYEALTPPRVITSEGEVVTGTYRRAELPGGALVGLPVSTGAVEGRARVILDMADAQVQAGDILVTVFTDPSWSPLFVAVDGLVTEVGGQMTHGAVIAREYGLPAVVGVQNATRLIRDGQRIRVDGTRGYVELLT